MKIKHRNNTHVELGQLRAGSVYHANDATYMVTSIDSGLGRVVSVNLASGSPIDRTNSFLVTPCPEAELHTNHVVLDEDED